MLQKLIVVVLAVAVLGGAYLFFFQRGTFDQYSRRARGFAPAKTPQEAVDRFRDAIKARDYDTAASYCGAEYGEQMRKAAPAAKALSTEIDNFVTIVSQRDFNDEKVKWVMAHLEPFPPDFTTADIKTSDDTATATFVVTPKAVTNDASLGNWTQVLDYKIMNALTRDLPPANVPLRYEGQGDDKAWKIYFPVTPGLRLAVEHLNATYKDYVKALEKLKHEVRNEAMTRDDMETRLRGELQKLVKR